MDTDTLSVHITNTITTENLYGLYQDTYAFNSTDKYIFFVFNKLIENNIDLYLEKQNEDSNIYLSIDPHILHNSYNIYGIPICSFALINLLQIKEYTGLWNITLFDDYNNKLIKNFQITYEAFKSYEKSNSFKQDCLIYKGNTIDVLK